MAWPAATTLTSLLVLLLITLAACSSSRIIVTTQAPFGRILKAVKLHGGYMEVIQEQRCSHGLLRLTCRFVSILYRASRIIFKAKKVLIFVIGYFMKKLTYLQIIYSAYHLLIRENLLY